MQPTQHRFPSDAIDEVIGIAQSFEIEWQPFGHAEHLAVVRLAVARYAILRADRLQSRLLDACPDQPARAGSDWLLLLRYRARAERKFDRAMEDLERLVRDRSRFLKGPLYSFGDL